MDVKTGTKQERNNCLNWSAEHPLLSILHGEIDMTGVSLASCLPVALLCPRNTACSVCLAEDVLSRWTEGVVTRLTGHVSYTAVSQRGMSCVVSHKCEKEHWPESVTAVLVPMHCLNGLPCWEDVSKIEHVLSNDDVRMFAVLCVSPDFLCQKCATHGLHHRCWHFKQ